MANSNTRGAEAKRISDSKAQAAIHLQQQAAANQPQSHPDLIPDAWDAVMRTHRAIEHLELLALSITDPVDRAEALQAINGMGSCLRATWHAFKEEAR